MGVLLCLVYHHLLELLLHAVFLRVVYLCLFLSAPKNNKEVVVQLHVFDDANPHPEATEQ